MSSKKPPKPKHHFVVDEDLGSSYWKILNQDDRFVTDRFETHWAPGTHDRLWIPQIAERGLIVITHDGKIRRQHRDVVVAYGARLIIVTGHSDFQGQARAFRDSWHKIDRFINKHSAPFIARFTKPSGKTLKKLKPVGNIVLSREFRT